MKQFELQTPISKLFNALKSQYFACELFQIGCSDNRIKPIISEKSFLWRHHFRNQLEWCIKIPLAKLQSQCQLLSIVPNEARRWTDWLTCESIYLLQIERVTKTTATQTHLGFSRWSWIADYCQSNNIDRIPPHWPLTIHGCSFLSTKRRNTANVYRHFPFQLFRRKPHDDESSNRTSRNPSSSRLFWPERCNLECDE